MNDVSRMFALCADEFSRKYEVLIWYDVDIVELKIKISMEKNGKYVSTRINKEDADAKFDIDLLWSIFEDMYALLQGKIARRSAE